MSLPHFFLEDQIIQLEEGECFPLRLSADDAKHFKVLRLRAGEHIAVIDASKDYFECEITDPNWDNPQVRICTKESEEKKGPSVVLYQGIAKGDKLDTIARQATEVGVDGLVFVPFKRCVEQLDPKRSGNKITRWQTIIKSAAMQSGRRVIPNLQVLESVSALNEQLANASCVLIFWEEAPMTALFEDALTDALEAVGCAASDLQVAVVIGPEGGLDASEVDHLRTLNPLTYLVSLGPCILRTETAGVVAPALVLNALRRLTLIDGVSQKA